MVGNSRDLFGIKSLGEYLIGVKLSVILLKRKVGRAKVYGIVHNFDVNLNHVVPNRIIREEGQLSVCERIPGSH